MINADIKKDSKFASTFLSMISAEGSLAGQQEDCRHISILKV